MKGFLLEEAKFDRVANAAAVDTTAVNSAGVDLSQDSGYDSVAFIAALGAITDGTPQVKLQQSDDDGSADAYSDLAGSGVTMAPTDDNKVVVLEVTKPEKKWVRCVIDRSVGSPSTGAVIDGIFALLHRGRKLVTQPADVAGSAKLVAPAEGTA